MTEYKKKIREKFKNTSGLYLGSITGIHRTGSTFNLNPHFHILVVAEGTSRGAGLGMGRVCRAAESSMCSRCCDDEIFF